MVDLTNTSFGQVLQPLHIRKELSHADESGEIEGERTLIAAGPCATTSADPEAVTFAIVMRVVAKEDVLRAASVEGMCMNCPSSGGEPRLLGRSSRSPDSRGEIAWQVCAFYG